VPPLWARPARRERRNELAKPFGADMISALGAAGFFLAIAALLSFSSWAEGWLISPSVARNFPEPIDEKEEVRAA
jgi:hypothetical protein